jgi:hypothetical protein
MPYPDLAMTSPSTPGNPHCARCGKMINVSNTTEHYWGYVEFTLIGDEPHASRAALLCSNKNGEGCLHDFQGAFVSLLPRLPPQEGGSRQGWQVSPRAS